MQYHTLPPKKPHDITDPMQIPVIKLQYQDTIVTPMINKFTQKSAIMYGFGEGIVLKLVGMGVSKFLFRIENT